MSGRFFHRARLALAGLALCGGVSGVALAATGGTAYATTFDGPLTALSSSWSLDVGQNGLVIQDQYDASFSQIWYTQSPGTFGRIKNFFYNKCLTTDGVEGDQLYLKRCTRSLAAYQTWKVIQDAPEIESFWSPYFNLYVDVYQGSKQLGAPIDGWPYNGGALNQWFSIVQ
jgi:hypothetical protein